MESIKKVYIGTGWLPIGIYAAKYFYSGKWEHHEMGMIFVLMGASIILILMGSGLTTNSRHNNQHTRGLLRATLISTGLFWVFGIDAFI